MKRLLFTFVLCLASLLLVVGAAAAKVPEITSTDVAYVAFGASDDNAGTTSDAPKKTMGAAAGLLPDGGTLVVTLKAWVGVDSVMPKLNGPLLITSKHGDEDFTEATDNALIFDAGSFILQSDTVIDDITIYQRTKKCVTLRVTNGATLVIGENVVTQGTEGVYPAIVVEDGSTVILNGGTFGSVRGEGTLINNGATIALQNPALNEDCGTIYYSHAKTGDGSSASSPVGSLANAVKALQATGKESNMLVSSGKLYASADYTWKPGGVTLITANDGTTDYKVAGKSGEMKMASGKKLTLQSDTILDDIILYQEGAAMNTIVVDSGATLVVGDKIQCTTKTGTYMAIVVNAGGTVVLNGGTFQSVTGDGRIFNNGATIVEHEHEKVGLITTEATCLQTGTIEYCCKTCGYDMGSDTLEVIDHIWGVEVVTKPAELGADGEATRTCTVCGETETVAIPALRARLTLADTSAAVYSNDTAAVRFITKLETADDATVESYGILLAQTAEQANVKAVILTDAFESGTTYAVDLTDIPAANYDTPIFAWAFVKVAGVDARIVLPISAVTVNGVLNEMGA